MTDHLGLPRDSDPDLLSEAEVLFAPPQAKPKKGSKPTCVCYTRDWQFRAEPLAEPSGSKGPIFDET